MADKFATFDLDGTLIRRKSRDISTLKMDAINRSISKVFSINDIRYFDFMEPEMYGMTDRSIVRKVLYKIGFDKTIVDEKIDYLFEEILNYFNSHRSRKSENDYITLPGIINRLDTFKSRGIIRGIATGNMAEFAWWKLEGVKLDHYFTFGGFGDDNEDRSDIVAAALKKAKCGNNCKACHFGDTPSDIRAAKDNNILSVAISAKGGGTFETEALKNAGADLVVDSWTEIDRILALLE